MTIKTVAIGIVLCAGGAAVASDIINQDAKTYTVSVKDGGYTAKYTIKANGSQYGVCSPGPCLFSIPGSSLTATKDDRITIKDGKLTSSPHANQRQVLDRGDIARA